MSVKTLETTKEEQQRLTERLQSERYKTACAEADSQKYQPGVEA